MDKEKESVASEENDKKRMRWSNDDNDDDEEYNDDGYDDDDVADDEVGDDDEIGEDNAVMMPLMAVGSKCSSSVVEDHTNNDNLAKSPLVEVLTGGTARKTGTTVGAVDIGIGKSAYFFQVALPGVKKEPGALRIEIERDGRVEIKGVRSTGGEAIERKSRKFVMKYQQQGTPPGPFTISFSLPGPVDPRLFIPIFRSDGILEAVIAKL